MDFRGDLFFESEALKLLEISGKKCFNNLGGNDELETMNLIRGLVKLKEIQKSEKNSYWPDPIQPLSPI